MGLDAHARLLAELKWSVLARQCLTRRIPDQVSLETEVAALVAACNAEYLTVESRFTKEEAHQRLYWLYPHPESDAFTVSLSSG